MNGLKSISDNFQFMFHVWYRLSYTTVVNFIFVVPICCKMVDLLQVKTCSLWLWIIESYVWLKWISILFFLHGKWDTSLLGNQGISTYITRNVITVFITACYAYLSWNRKILFKTSKHFKFKAHFNIILALPPWNLSFQINVLYKLLVCFMCATCSVIVRNLHWLCI